MSEYQFEPSQEKLWKVINNFFEGEKFLPIMLHTVVSACVD